MTCCRRHGGNLTVVKAKAAKRLLAATMPVLNSLIETALQKDNLIASVRAADSVLDRAGIGEVVEAKVRSSQKSDSSKVVVQIGFLTGMGGESPVIVVPAKNDQDAG